jgi:hypothetical protein
MTDIIIKVVFALLGVLVTSVLVPWLKAKLSDAKLEQIKTWVYEAVNAAQESFKDEPESGMAKKRYVLEFLTQKGVKMDEDTLDLLIQSAVGLLHRLS